MIYGMEALEGAPESKDIAGTRGASRESFLAGKRHDGVDGHISTMVQVD